MDNKIVYISSNSKDAVLVSDTDRMDKAKRLRRINWLFIHNSTRIYHKAMGEVTAKAILNIVGFSTLLFGFLANINNWLSIPVALVGVLFGIFKALKERENWLHRKAERKRQEFEQMIREEEYIRNIKI